MIKFRNPGTQFSTQVLVLKILYNELKDRNSFGLQEMAEAIARGRLLTAYGYAGDAALKLSENESQSLNSSLMNVKMYAETFRLLGWVTSIGERAYPLVFTYLGMHVATSEGNAKKLFEECVLGIVNPNEIINVKYDENVRFFKCALLTFKELGGIMYKHELCLGPMNVNDNNEEEYQKMIEMLKGLRGDYNNLVSAFESLAKSLNMTKQSVDNTTRFPIALLKSCGYVENENYRTKDLYPPKSLQCLKLTPLGEKVADEINEMKDLRLDEFNQYPEEIKMALVRLGNYGMLERANYDVTPVSEQIKSDKLLCKEILGGKELLFSPYQTIKKDYIDKAMGFGEQVYNSNDNTVILERFDSDYSIDPMDTIKSLQINVNADLNHKLLSDQNDVSFLELVDELNKSESNIDSIVDYLFNYYVSATQTNFYPLIATLFKIMGFNCTFSRPGDNGARWDAIIIDDSRSIPIEIKSPTEEKHLSIKAIRQALENKIVLLSRETYITSRDVSTLAVGYLPPNERAEVSRLINDFKNTYNIKVAAIDFKSLLNIAVSIIVEGKSFNKELLYDLEGIISADITGEK